MNGASVNGRSGANWVISASAAGMAGASVVSAIAQRIVHPAVLSGLATAVGAAKGTPILAARASGAASASATSKATLKQAMRATALASAIGYAAVTRKVFGIAANDGRATGIAIAGSKIGSAYGLATATRLVAAPIVIRGGRATGAAGATGTAASAKRTRNAIAGGLAGVVAHAEATMKLSGQAYKRHDGSVSARAGATATVNPTYTIVAVTGGIFNVGYAYGMAMAKVIYRARAVFNAGADGAAVGTKIVRTTASSQASASAVAIAARLKVATASGQAGAQQVGLLQAKLLFAGRAVGTASASSNATAKLRFGAVASGRAGATAGLVTPAKHQRGSGMGNARASAIAANAKAKYMASANAAMATVTGLARAYLIVQARALGIVKATGSAEGFANSQIRAPDERSMYVGPEDRSMAVPLEDRQMLAGETHMALIGAHEKTPVEVKDYDILLGDWLTPGDNVRSVDVAIAPSGSLHVESLFINDPVAKIWLAGGLDGQKYKLVATTTTDDGRIKQDVFTMKIKAA